MIDTHYASLKPKATMRALASGTERVHIAGEGSRVVPAFSRPAQAPYRPASIAHTHPMSPQPHRRAVTPLTAVAADRAASGTAPPSTARPQVVLTREAGKNGKMKKMLESWRGRWRRRGQVKLHRLLRGVFVHQFDGLATIGVVLRHGYGQDG